MVGFSHIVAGIACLLSMATADFQQNIRIGPDHPPCGADNPPESLTQAHKAIANDTSSSQKMRRAYYPIEVPVYWHVIAASSNFTDGYLTRQQVEDSIHVLNKDFEPHAISFKLVFSQVVYNAAWADGEANPNDDDMRRQLHMGSYSSLNIYSKKTIEDNYLGFCYFPQNLTTSPQFSYLDGCQINYGTIPKGNIPEYNKGKVLTHEVGHWFGLYHTFQGRDCTGYGDYVLDTPAQLYPPFECDDSIDSCPQQAGKDPWDNHMNYVPDRCKNEFTFGQENAMKQLYREFRGQGFGG